MRQLNRLFLCFFVVSSVFTFGCTSEKMGKTGFDVTLSVTGMTRFTSTFGVMKSLEKVDTVVIDDAVYKVTTTMFPFGKVSSETDDSVLENKIGWRFKPDEPKYFRVSLQAVAGADPANGVNEAISTRVKTALIEAVESAGFEASVESMKVRESTAYHIHRLGLNN